jgi:hypothetical protein
MGNRHLYKIECLHTLGTPESERLKVTALNLFHPTASPLFQNGGFFHIATHPPTAGERIKVRGSDVFGRIRRYLGEISKTLSCAGMGMKGVPVEARKNARLNGGVG